MRFSIAVRMLRLKSKPFWMFSDVSVSWHTFRMSMHDVSHLKNSITADVDFSTKRTCWKEGWTDGNGITDRRRGDKTKHFWRIQGKLTEEQIKGEVFYIENLRCLFLRVGDDYKQAAKETLQE